MSGRRIALVGTGIMGRHMGRRLAEAGFAVTAWNRTRAKAEALAPHGVTVAATPSQAAANADVTVVMLNTGAIVEEVLFGADATGHAPADAMRPGTALVVMSSIPVETCRDQARRLAGRGVAYVDAPVSGGEPGARDGTLAILAGGDESVVASLADVFAPLGRATRIGPVGTGQLAKLANQIIVGGTMVAVAEAMVFAARGGADPAALREALMGGFASSRILDIHGARMAARDFAPSGPAVHQLKDMRTAQAHAATLGVRLHQLDALIDLYADLIAHEGTGLDVSGVLLEVERRAAASRQEITR